MKNGKIKILLDFDHELPLGSISKNYHDALFKPTYDLIKRANELDVKINLFSDVLSAYRFKEWDHVNFYIPYTNQLKEAINQKHDVQLHIHPHWLTTTYQNNQFKPSKDFKLADFKYHMNYDISKIIKTGKEELRNICLQANSEYQCIAYRAGGFNLWPATDDILKGLENNGIFIDSSIPKEIYFESYLSKVDYRGFNKKANWFSHSEAGLNDITLKKGIFEVPIATTHGSLFYIAKHIVRKKIYHDRAPEKRGNPIHFGNTSILKKVKSLVSARLLGFDLYTDNHHDLMNILQHHIKTNTPNFKNEYVIATVSHPKNMDRYALDLMQRFIESCRNKYGSEICFITYQELYKDYFN